MPQAPVAPPVAVDVRLEPGERLPWASEAYVVAAPGHTRGQLVVWFPHDRVLVAANAMAFIAETPMPGVFNVDPVQAAETYVTLAALDPEIACFGHGAALVGARVSGSGADCSRPRSVVAARLYMESGRRLRSSWSRPTRPTTTTLRVSDVLARLGQGRLKHGVELEEEDHDGKAQP